MNSIEILREIELIMATTSIKIVVADEPIKATMKKKTKKSMVMLANKYAGQNPRGWWMSEKLDGVRAIWDGEKFTSRNGKVFHTPGWFVKNLPKNIIIDGELWEGRGQFQTTVGKVRAHEGDWSSMKFMVFDIVNRNLFESRMDQLSNLILPKHCKIVKHVLCKNRNHLDCFENTILKRGGEGVMLRKAKSLYDHKRSKNLLKLKRFKSDEAVVVRYEPGKGKHEGRLGALVCKYMGKIFKIGTGISDEIREFPPAIGSVVTFSFFETTNAGIPRFTSFETVRDYE